MVTLARDQFVEVPETFKFSRERFYRALDSGFFDETDKVELINGELVTEGMLDRMLQKSRHTLAMLIASKELTLVFKEGHHVRPQAPLSLGENHEVEPDIVVVTGTERDYADAHPTTAVLIVEVSDTTLRFDTTYKASLYASHGIPDYWIINLVERVVEVRRNANPDSAAPFGHRYESVERLTAEQAVTPLAAPNTRIMVADLLP